MSDPAIRVDGLGKRYFISHQSSKAAGRRSQYRRFSDVLIELAKAPWKRGPKENAAAAREEFWALKDVSFEVNQGDVVGIIGRNGAGKSTLLKILSRITEPTLGRIEIGGRVASLLEVGTGFHPELTGRENVFLNGAILGMTRGEIRRKFDEIVAFAEVEKFLDTPVKHYSSGMYVRLAFAVAAHLEPEILVVDEVLAVGDAEFQKKCMGKMGEVSRQEGRTILFVSHNINAIMNLCTKGIVLNQGRIVMTGDVKTACDSYGNIAPKTGGLRRTHGWFRNLVLTDAKGESRPTVREDEPLSFAVELCVPESRCLVSLIIRDARGTPLFELFEDSFSPAYHEGESRRVLVRAGYLPLLPGSYTVDFWLGDRMGQRVERLDSILDFDVVPSKKSDTSRHLHGVLACASTWQNE